MISYLFIRGKKEYQSLLTSVIINEDMHDTLFIYAGKKKSHSKDSIDGI